MSTHRHPIGPGDHVMGPNDAPITLLEYGDFECPFCGRAYWEVKRLQQALGDRARFAYRHFPLTQVHPHAMQAAEAAEAAGAQGRFWQMHGMLFGNQEALELSNLTTYAEKIGLDVDRFIEDLDQHRHAGKIRRDFISGVRSGVNGTPTFFINGERWDGPFAADALIQVLGAGAPGYAP